MADFAVVAVDGSLHASVGAFLDAFALVRSRVAGMFPSLEPVPMETAVRLLTPGATALRLADGRQLSSDGAPGGATRFDVLHLPAFQVRDLAGLDERLCAMAPFHGWLRGQHAGGAVVSASGSAALLLAAAGLLDAVAAPLPAQLAQLAHQRFPRLQIEERRAVVARGRIRLSRGAAADAELAARVFEQAISPEMGRWVAAASGIDPELEEGLAQDPLVAQAQLWLERRFADLRRTCASANWPMPCRPATRRWCGASCGSSACGRRTMYSTCACARPSRCSAARDDRSSRSPPWWDTATRAHSGSSSRNMSG